MSCLQSKEPSKKIPSWIVEKAEQIIHNGGTAEIKKERGEYVVIEVKRKLIKEN